MDNDVTRPQQGIGDTFQWRILALEQAKQDHEIRLRELEHIIPEVKGKIESVEEKVDTVIRKLDDSAIGRIAQYSTVALTIGAIVLSAVLEHFWK